MLLAYSLSVSLMFSLLKPPALKPIPRPNSFNWRVPALLVMIITVLRKSIKRPLPSVRRPSSRTCNNILNTLPCAFSISSSNTIEYGWRLTFSVSCPPSSYPTYPGGAPTNRDVLKLSLYSLISTRINASELPNICSASFFAKYVLPTPVGPKNINAPIGWFFSFRPTLLRCIALTIFSIALSWATTTAFKSLAIFLSLALSASAIRCTGTPVIIDTTSVTSFSVISSRVPISLFAHFSWSSESSASNSVCLSL